MRRQNSDGWWAYALAVFSLNADKRAYLSKDKPKAGCSLWSCTSLRLLVTATGEATHLGYSNLQHSIVLAIKKKRKKKKKKKKKKK